MAKKKWLQVSAWIAVSNLNPPASVVQRRTSVTQSSSNLPPFRLTELPVLHQQAVKQDPGPATAAATVLT